MKTLHAPAALLADGWQTDVAIVVTDDGMIERIDPSTPPARDDEQLAGPVIPAMPNLHSHAFQRAIAGRTGLPSPHRDDTFWTWRQAMYAAVDHLDADAFEAIAAQAFVEMAKAGYASVAEFHYVHHDPHGKPYADPAELAWRIVAAAATAGLGLTLLPVFYAHGNFNGAASVPGQRRFVQSIYTFEKLLDAVSRKAQGDGYTVGVAPHSLRAVTREELDKVVRMAPPNAPIHIHAAEQTRELAVTARGDVQRAELRRRRCIVRVAFEELLVQLDGARLISAVTHHLGGAMFQHGDLTTVDLELGPTKEQPDHLVHVASGFT
jgi:formimidoylglutamate deiminase